jgi:perosamine synthetase
MSATIPFNRPHVAGREAAVIAEVLATGHWHGDGRFTRAAADALAQRVGGGRVLLTTSCTHALEMAALLLDVGPGDEVIVPSFSFAATANSVRLVGAEPVFVDIEPYSFCLDPDAVAAAIGPRTVAVMPVHLYGHPAAMDRLVPLAQRHGLAIVEDACQAHAAAVGDVPVGAFGRTGCFSF